MIYDTIIIGAGVSGISCYNILNGSQNILMIEKSDRAGGNVRSFQLDKQTSIEMGSFEIFDWYYFFINLITNYTKLTRRIVLKKIVPETKLGDPKYVLGLKFLVTSDPSYNIYDPSFDNCPLTTCNVLNNKSRLYLEAYTYGECKKNNACIFAPVAIRYVRNKDEELFEENNNLSNAINSIINKTTSNQLYNTEVLDYITNDDSTITVITNNTSYTAKNVVLTNPYGKLHRKILNINDKSSYTEYYSVIIEMNYEYNGKYNAYLDSINLSNEYTTTAIYVPPYKRNYVVLFIMKSQVDGGIKFTDYLKVIKLPIYLNNSIKRIVHYEYFPYSMPLMDIKALRAMNHYDQNRINNFYFSGQYRSMPSLEIACYTGIKSAYEILGKKNEILRITDKVNQHNAIKIVTNFNINIIIFILIFILIFIISLLRQTKNQKDIKDINILK